MESSIIYNEHGLLDGTVNTGAGGCVSQWANGLLVSHYREMGAGWSIRVFKFTTGQYYYSHKQIDYAAQVLREEIYVYRYGLGDMIAPGTTVFCAYKERPTFRVLEATERMIRDDADNVLTPVHVLSREATATDIRRVLDEGSVEDIYELLEVPMPAVKIVEEEVIVEKEEADVKVVSFLDKTFNCGESVIGVEEGEEGEGEDMDVYIGEDEEMEDVTVGVEDMSM
jgi:hypothetical protein